MGDEDHRPRQFKIEKKDIVKYGATPNCPGCYNQSHSMQHRPSHSCPAESDSNSSWKNMNWTAGELLLTNNEPMPYLERKIREHDENMTDEPKTEQLRWC